MDENTREKFSKWYINNRPIYEELCFKIEFIIREILKSANINVHSINSRAKEIQSFKAKVKNPKYTNPQLEITDLSGIRIICYVESDLKK